MAGLKRVSEKKSGQERTLGNAKTSERYKKKKKRATIYKRQRVADSGSTARRHGSRVT